MSFSPPTAMGSRPVSFSEPTAAALEISIPRRAAIAFADQPTIYYGFIPWGYAWSFPGATDQILGMAGLKKKAGPKLRSSFRKFLATRPLPPPPACRIESRQLPYGNYLPTPGSRNILLVGDAAGMADPFLGEGIYYAHRSAQLAAEAILACRRRPESTLTAYSDRYRGTIYPELRYARAGRQLIFSLPPRFYFPVLAGLLRWMPKVCEETIQGRRSFHWFRRL
jgi:menaquinone-9 beta-reductase